MFVTCLSYRTSLLAVTIVNNYALTWLITMPRDMVNRDFKQRQPGRRRERHRIRENPKSPLRMTGGEQVDVLRLDPTRV